MLHSGPVGVWWGRGLGFSKFVCRACCPRHAGASEAAAPSGCPSTTPARRIRGGLGKAHERRHEGKEGTVGRHLYEQEAEGHHA